MRYKLLLLLLIVVQACRQVQSKCAGGLWSIEDAAFGSFNVSWRYGSTSNTVQFMIEGHASSSINLTASYVTFGWSNTTSSKTTVDLALVIPGARTVRDGHSREQTIPSIDRRQDLCAVQVNITGQHLAATFERLTTTGDAADVSFAANLYLIFSIGLLTPSTALKEFNFDPYFFHQSLSTSVNLLECISHGCLPLNCSTPSCPCLESVQSDAGQCVCFPSVVSSSTCGSKVAKPDLLPPTASVSALINGSCEHQTEPCTSHGVCLQIATDQFICQCKADYTGVLCQTPLFAPNIDIFGNCQCLNEGVCVSNGSCSCPPRYRGKFCQLENPCNGYCQHGGVCVVHCADRVCGAPNCTCASGYHGKRCEEISNDACQSNPCIRGRCEPANNCSTPVCGYTCWCPDGITGVHCEIEAKPCDSAPCHNGGTCSVVSSSYVCHCPPRYTGSNCESIKDVCALNLCLNNGSCVRDASSSNGEGFRCECRNDYVGPQCEYVSGCRLSPCQNGGTCSLHTETNTSYCQCPPDASGSRCEITQTTCTNATCSNHGVCFIDTSLDNSTAHCICSEGYTGAHCETPSLTPKPCSQQPCGANGTCIQTSNASYYCVCLDGSVGQTCRPNTLKSCTASSCRYPSVCQQIDGTDPPTYKCACPSYLTGDRCQYTNLCQKQPCANRGRCLPLGPQHNFMCLCPAGFGHYDCSQHMGLACNASVCRNGGTCDNTGRNIRCVCPEIFAGPRCEWASVCSANTCQNGGTCRQVAATMAECLCPAGFTGPTCTLRDSCTLSPCQNGGGCMTLLADTGTHWSAYRCVCPPGVYGQNCDKAIGSCSNMVCPSYKICSEQATGPVCICAGSKVGTFCQYENPCSALSTGCQNDGTCTASNADPPVASCLCREGFTGAWCETPIENNPCASNPCQTRGYCALSNTSETYKCVCHEHFTGEHCERTNPCLSSPCLNQAACQPRWNRTSTWFTCRCAGTYTGNRCETSLLNPCGGLCMNGSPCSNGVCVCPAQYTGTFCGFDNPCFDPVCHNGGICSVLSNSTSVSFTCTCPNSHTGQYCEIPLHVSDDKHCNATCMNGGSCVHGICMCTAQFVGPSCQFANPCADRNPCLNGGTCFSRSNLNGTVTTQCFCPQGFTGGHCEATLCSPTSCNGGVCTATQNNIVCACPTGKVGDRCQYADACAKNPCLPNERCEQIGSQYQCILCYDKSSYCSIYQLRNEYCDNRYTILVDNNFLPVPQACQRSCGQCIPVQRLQDISTLFDHAAVTHEPMPSTTGKPAAQPDKCIDRRDDCVMQKAYGFCAILNEKYPDDCVKTCHPDCTSTL